MSKRTFRNVLTMTTWGETNRGNPRTYLYLLECGHIRLDRHSPKSSIDLFCTVEGILVRKLCYKCSSGKIIIDPDQIKGLFGEEYLRMVEKKFNLLILKKAYITELKDCAKGLDGHLLTGFVPVYCLFYRYKELSTIIEDKDFFEFYNWIRKENTDLFEFATGFWDLYYSDYGYHLNVHRSNVEVHKEKLSKKGFWKMMKNLCELNKKRDIPIRNLFLMRWKKKNE